MNGCYPGEGPVGLEEYRRYIMYLCVGSHLGGVGESGEPVIGIAMHTCAALVQHQGMKHDYVRCAQRAALKPGHYKEQQGKEPGVSRVMGGGEERLE